MAQTTMNVRVDEDIKRSFDEFCAGVGLNASVAVNMFIRVVLRSRRIPFEITDAAEPAVDKALAEALRATLLERIREGQEGGRWVSHGDVMQDARAIVTAARTAE
ncbi:MAG: type II toxin-antitoxin system RelB/DinJ family antitoxin [Proteobacteria bacterium]|nr:type II toxin-antitoxin system RelB/DinJ family antitoxin [Pseudomonadota bacterium]